MTLPPRAVLVHRRTEFQELLDRHGTRGQAAFFLRSRGRAIEGVAARDAEISSAIAAAGAAIPAHWRRSSVERAELSRFLFEPDDIIVIVGQDGLVANVAKYLGSQLVIGINPEPGRNPGVLVPHPPAAAAAMLAAAANRGTVAIDDLCMVSAEADDGQELVALNEVYIGQASHQTARYAIQVPGEQTELQASSGVIIGTGTGASGWCRSAWLERRSKIALPSPVEPRLAWFVREAWPSPATGTRYTEGLLSAGQVLRLTAASDRLVVFGDGIESDAITLSWGQSVTVGLSGTTLRLAR